MPILHFIMVILAFAQWQDYLITSDSLNRYFSLLYRAINDILGFLILFFWFLALFNLLFFSTGATFDDGGNYDTSEDAGYDTLHNDFPMLD